MNAVDISPSTNLGFKYIDERKDKLFFNPLIQNWSSAFFIDLIALFFGQRIAKDYQGAATLVGYFMLSILGIITFGL